MLRETCDWEVRDEQYLSSPRGRWSRFSHERNTKPKPGRGMRIVLMLVRVICFHHTADCERARVRRSRTWLDGGQSPLWPAMGFGSRDGGAFVCLLCLSNRLPPLMSADRVSGWLLGCGVWILAGRCVSDRLDWSGKARVHSRAAGDSRRGRDRPSGAVSEARGDGIGVSLLLCLANFILSTTSPSPSFITNNYAVHPAALASARIKDLSRCSGMCLAW